MIYKKYISKYKYIAINTKWIDQTWGSKAGQQNHTQWQLKQFI